MDFMCAIKGSLFLGLSLLAAEPMVVDSPKEITSEWESKVFGIRHGVTDLVGAVEEMVEGLTGTDFGEQFLNRLRDHVQKEPTGEYVEYWSNGTLKAKIPYKDGKPNGHVHGWYDNGVDAFKGFFKEGIKQGIHISFYRKDPVQNLKKIHMLTYNENGLLDGYQTTNHPTGNLWIAIKYVNGKAEGPLEGWDIKRRQFISAEYKKGLLQKEPPLPPEKRKRPEIAIDERYVNEVIRDFQKDMGKEFKIQAIGSGAGMPFDVERIIVEFAVMKRITIEEARNLIVTLKQKLADRVNEHEKLRPYLREYPFSPMRAVVNLSFIHRNTKKEPLQDGDLLFITVGNTNEISYFIKDSKKPGKEDVFKEPYEEAVKIVKAKGNKISLDK